MQLNCSAICFSVSYAVLLAVWKTWKHKPRNQGLRINASYNYTKTPSESLFSFVFQISNGIHHRHQCDKARGGIEVKIENALKLHRNKIVLFCYPQIGRFVEKAFICIIQTVAIYCFSIVESSTFQALRGLKDRGVKVELGFPDEMWDSPDAEVTRLKARVSQGTRSELHDGGSDR